MRCTAILAARIVNGALPGGDPDGQTVPAKFSERNAKIDAMPTMAYPLALTPEQRQRVFEAVMKSPSPPATIEAKPAQELPGNTALSELPPDLVKDVPTLAGMSVLKTPDKVLLVRAPTMTVMDEITR